jgi:uncharacterized damage-inducible protein DinB
MAAPRSKKSFVVSDAILEAFATNDRINRYLIENLSDEAWRADPPGGKGRTIAAIAAHIQNVRGMWIRAAVPGSEATKLDRHSVTRDEVLSALAESYETLSAIVRAAVESDGRVRGFKPDAVGFVGYLIAHDAHHRGQITQLARQIGHPVSQSAMFGMWEWGKR